jgi:hypothetical protein
MANEEALKIFNDFSTQADKSGSLVLACAERIVRDVMDLTASVSESLEDEDYDLINQNQTAREALMAIQGFALALIYRIAAPERVKPVKVAARRRESRNLVEEAATVFDLYRKCADAITDRLPQLKDKLDATFQIEAHSILGAQNSDQPIEPENFMKLLITKHVTDYKNAGMA